MGLAKTTIPGDDRDKALFLYHPKVAGAKRLTIPQDPSERQDFDAEVAKLRRDGWAEKRFAQMMFHAKLGSRVVTDHAEIPAMKKNGWSESPFKPGEATHPDAVHAHEADDHRKIYLGETEEQRAVIQAEADRIELDRLRAERDAAELEQLRAEKREREAAQTKEPKSHGKDGGKQGDPK